MTNTAWTVGIDIGGTKMLLLAQCGVEQRVERRPTGEGFSPRDLEETITAFLGSLDGETQVLGIAVPGLVGADQRVEACDLPGALVGWSPQALLSPARMVRLVNDVEAALLEEVAMVPPGSTAVLVMAGTGIGAALLLEGRVFRGANGWAGELGWVPLFAGAQVQTLDGLASGAALVRQMGVPGEVLLDRARAGDSRALEAIDEAGAALGLGLAAVINLLNPALVVLGGGAFELPGYLPAATAAAERHSLPALWRACRVERMRAGELAVARGAARAAASLGR